MEVEHWNMRHPGEAPRVPLVTELLADAGAAGPILAVSDWIAAWPDMIARWVPTDRWRSLGTDGFGRSDTRESLRRFFGIDAAHIALAVLTELARMGRFPADAAAAAASQLGIDVEEPFALGR